MATIRVFNDMFENKSEDFVFDTSRPLLEQVEEHLNKDIYRETLVECYDPETGETIYAPLEEDSDSESVIIIVNGNSVDKDYVPAENDLVNIVFTPLGNNTIRGTFLGALVGATVGILTAAAIVLLAPVIAGGLFAAGVTALSGGALGLLVGGGALIGGIIGFGIGYNKDKAAGKSYNNKNATKGEQYPDIRGAANQSLAGNNFPCVIGKHLVTPFIVGDPYTEYSGTKGRDAYIRTLLCVGYAPLKLTDFKLGDFWLAYNRSHGNVTPYGTMLAGLLKGYSTGGVADNGDIVDYWKNNDVSIEILQQPATGTGIGYGTIYPEVAKEQEVNANIMYVASGDLDESVQVTYKGTSFPNTFRTNTVIFTEACPREFTINLDFPNGLYATQTRSTRNDDEVTTETLFSKIPLWMCIQWRIYNENNDSSKNDGSDYASWNNIDFGYSQVFSNGTMLSPVRMDFIQHQVGNNFRTWSTSVEDVYGNYIGKTLQNFENLGGGEVNQQPSQVRVSATVTLTKEQCKQIIADTNPGRLIEIRVIRVSPNYIDQIGDKDDDEDVNYGPRSFSDHVIARTVVTKIFDEEALRDRDELVAVKPVSEVDLKKCCYVAIKCKADSAGYIQNSLSSINCIAESFSPIWDKDNKKILPEGIHKVRKYYGYFLPGTDTPTNRTNDADEREVTQQEYEQARHDGYNWYMEKCGSNFADLMKSIVMTDTQTHNGVTCWYLSNLSDNRKYNDSLTSSSFLLAAVGPQCGPEGVGEEDLNTVAIGDWSEKIEALKDGSTFQRDTVYNGVQYHKNDVIPVRMEANAYLYQSTKIEDLLQKIAGCGRAVWIVDETGKIKVVFDGPVDYTKGVISEENCISSSNTFSFEEAPAGLFCTFNDENDGYENNSFYIWSDGNSMSRHHGSVEAFHLDYVTNPYQMHSLGRYYMACLQQTKEALTRKIGPNGMVYSIGDVVLIQGRDLLIGETSGRIQEVIAHDGFIYGFVTDATYEYTGELDTDGNSVQGVTVVQPRYAGKSNAVTLPLSAPRTIEITVGYSQVYPKGTENPQQKGWYEKVNNQYVLTTDTTVVDGHIYYQAEKNTYKLNVGTTNVVLFGRLTETYNDDRDYAVPLDTKGDPSPTNDLKYNFKAGDICLYGLVDKTSAPYKITKIKPETGGKFTQTLVPYDESLYNYGAALPTFQTYITPPPVAVDPVALRDVPTTLAAQQNVMQNIYNMVGFVKNLTPPPYPSNVQATAYRDYIQLTWSIGDVENTKETVIELSRQGGAQDTWVPVASISSNNYRYYFNRSVDHYPEASDGGTPVQGEVYLTDYKFRLKNVSIFDVSSEWTENVDVNTIGTYGTWKIPSITVKVETSDRTAILTATYEGDVYGTPRTKVTIRRIGNLDPVEDGSQTTFNDMLCIQPDENSEHQPIYYTPNFDDRVTRSETENTEENYRTNTTTPFESLGNKVTHTLPLIGQNPRIFESGNTPIINPTTQKPYFQWEVSDASVVPPSPTSGTLIHYTGDDTTVGTFTFYKGGYYYYTTEWKNVTSKSVAVDTEYEYQIYMTNESGNVSNTVTKNVHALPTNISDIVHSHEHYKNLYVEKLSAINANIGLISQGGMGSFAEQLNYWALSDMTAEESGSVGGVMQGAFRVGGQDEYFMVTPYRDSNNEKKYKIELKAGNIELTTTTSGQNGMDFLRGTRVYTPDKTRCLELTPSGILVKKLDPNLQTDDPYVTYSQITVNDNNDMIIANTTETPEFGYEISTADVYHFDETLTDEDGNDPQGVTAATGYRFIPNDETTCLLLTAGKKAIEGTVSKDISQYEGLIGFVTKSEEIHLGTTQAIKMTDGTLISIPPALTGYNDAMREESTPDVSKTLGIYLGLTQDQVDAGIFN